MTESDIKNWLTPPNASTNFNSAQDQRHKDSCSWFFKDKLFTSWRSRPNNFLWLHGIPGCGKTILASTIIKSLSDEIKIRNKDKPAGESDAIVYFFLDSNDNAKRSLNQMLRWFICQLFCSHTDTQEDLQIVFEECRRGLEAPSTNQLKDLFQVMTSRLSCTNMIVDAVDEALDDSPEGNKRKEVLKWIFNLQTLGHGNLRVIATSRTQQDIEGYLSGLGYALCIDKLVYSDIEAYVRDRLFSDDRTVENHRDKSFPKPLGFTRWYSSPEVLRVIEKSVVQKAKGM